MTKPTENTIQKILNWKEENRLTEEDFKNAGFTEIVDIVSSQDNDIEIAKLEAIQSYLLEHGTNDEFINNEILILKGFKERVNKSECKHEFITSADWNYQSCRNCGFKVQIVNEK